ncbi:unnamed protein product [Oikopleura dioica]|uniref:KEN domain-containing protein n=1 Tax=Oikopleura dioica TaxID=34765 RepID=E4Y442_OIKDI|nr:unnamed protein product [Oikopleura dioica]
MSKEEQEINLPLHGKIKRSRSVTEKKDKLEERLRKQLKENPDALFNAVYPILKIKAAENLLNEVQNINLNEEYESNREKTFQILRALLNDPEFCSLLVNEATKKINEPTGNWMQHPPLDVYLDRMKKENPKDFKAYNGTSLMQLLRFLRNHHQHALQADPEFRVEILKTERISDAHYCDFFDSKFPELMAFLTWMYVGACDNDDEFTKMLGPNGEDNLDFLVEEELYDFILALMDFFFEESTVDKKDLETIIGRLVKFDDIGNFENVTMKDPKNKKKN